MVLTPLVVWETISTGYVPGVLVGIVLSLWRVAVTPEITNFIGLKINWKGGKKQNAEFKDSPGAQALQVQGDRNLIQVNPAQVSQDQAYATELADRVYTPLRNEISGWNDARFSSFSVWTQLDKEIPRLVKKVSPEIANRLNEAHYLFKDIYVLRGVVSTLIRDEANRLATQEYQTKFFDIGSKVTFNNLRIIVDGQDLPFYLPHLWVVGMTTDQYARTLVRDNYPAMTKWRLEIIVQGERAGNQFGQAVTTDKEVARFADYVMEYLETQEPARRLRDNLKKTQDVASELLPLIDRELSKG